MSTKVLSDLDFGGVARGINLPDPVSAQDVATRAYVLAQVAAGGVTIATQANQEAATSATVAVSPARQQFHPSAVKVHGSTTGGGTPVISATAYNVSSIVDVAVGNFQVLFTVPFSATNYTVLAGNFGNNGYTYPFSKNVGDMTLAYVNSAGSSADPQGYNFACFGDQ